MQQTQERRAIEGKVARLLNSRELIINRGSEDGVEDGMRFEIIDEFDEIRDPDTKEILGGIKRVKVRVKVSDVQERLAIARTYETYKTPDTSMLTFGLPDPSRTITRVKTLSSTCGPQIVPSHEAGEIFVEIGDKVVQMQ